MYVCFHRLSNNGGNKRLPRKRYQNLRVNKFANICPVDTFSEKVYYKLFHCKVVMLLLNIIMH